MIFANAMEEGIAFMTAIGLMATGLSCLFRPSNWITWLKRVRDQGQAASLTIGLIQVWLGGMILGFHWRWQGLPLVATAVGAATIFKGLVSMLFPAWLHVRVRWLEPRARWLIPLVGCLWIIAAGAIFLEWQSMAYSQEEWHPFAWVDK